MHVLAARVGAVDATGGVGGVPLVDRGVELQAGIGALPRGRRRCSRHRSRARTVRTIEPSVTALQVPVGVVDDGLHELVGDAHRVVGVLVLDAEAVGAVEVHVEAGVAQHAGLVLLLGLAPHELFDVGVIDVEDDHLRRTTGLAAALDRAGRGVGATHEADRAAGRAAAVEQLVAGADLRQVDARTGAALEDDALFAVPVEDRRPSCRRRRG